MQTKYSTRTQSFGHYGWAGQTNGQALIFHPDVLREPSFFARLISFLLGCGW